MKITVLVENELDKTAVAGLKSVHGLSLYIEIGSKKILFDIGPNSLYAENAVKMGIDIAAVDCLVISHGHMDHGGSLGHFFQVNSRATVYLHRAAGERHYAKLFGLIPINIGLNEKVMEENIERIVFVDSDFTLSEEITLLEKIPADFPRPSSNGSLFMQSEKGLIPDDFRHELVMVVKEADGVVLFTGCSHTGIINMVKRAEAIVGQNRIKAVVGGFHLHNPVKKKDEPAAYLNSLAGELNRVDTVFYTGHCTGRKNYETLKGSSGARLEYAGTGRVIEV